MRRMRFFLWMLLVLAPVAPATAPSPGRISAATHDTIWMRVQLAGHKVGSFQQTRLVAGDVVTTTRTLSIELIRAGQPLRLHSRNQTVENLQGEPLAFSARTMLSAIDTTVAAHRIGVQQFRVSRSIGGATRDEIMRLPVDALLFEGARKAMATAPRAPGAHYRLHLFDPASQQTREVEIEVVGDESVMLPAGRVRLSHQRQHQHLPGGEQVSDVWLDAQGRIKKERTGTVRSSTGPARLRAGLRTGCGRGCRPATQRDDPFTAPVGRGPARCRTTLPHPS